LSQCRLFLNCFQLDSCHTVVYYTGYPAIPEEGKEHPMYPEKGKSAKGKK
jgi:hypothetical protein